MAAKSKSAKRLYLVDGSSYIFRAYHALPPLTRKSDGMPVGGGLINTIPEDMLRYAMIYTPSWHVV